MQKAPQNHSSLFSVAAMVLLAALAGCTTSGGEKSANSSLAGEPRIKASELRAYCPTVSLREGTAYFSTYAGKSADKDPEQVVYQAAITDVTRACQYGEGTISIDVAAAGKVVPGPKYKKGTITMPVRVAVLQGDKVVYSKLHKQSVSITNGDVSTQFVFNDKGISLPMPDKQNIQVFVGFDEGPVKSK